MQPGEPTMNNQRKARNFALTFLSLLFSLSVVVALISVLAIYGNRRVSGAPAPSPSWARGKKTMRSFGSDDELKAYLKKLAEEQRQSARRAKSGSDAAAPAPATMANQATG